METFQLPSFAGTGLLLALIAFLAFKGPRLIEAVLSVRSIRRCAVYLTVVVLSVDVFGPMIREALTGFSVEPGG